MPVAKFKVAGDSVQILSVERQVEVLPPPPEKRGYLPESKNDQWGTPLDLFIKLDEEFRFTLDAAASAENTLCECFYAKEQDALVQPWEGRVWVNPPYSREVGRWVDKAREEVDAGRAEVVGVLLKSTTEVVWWHKHVWDKNARNGEGDFRPGARARFCDGRLKFDIPDQEMRNQAPFSSVVIVFTKVPR